MKFLYNIKTNVCCYFSIHYNNNEVDAHELAPQFKRERKKKRSIHPYPPFAKYKQTHTNTHKLMYL